MIEINKSHERGTQFFASKTFRDFKQELIHIDVPTKNPPYVELSFKCCGYGYFQSYKQMMKTNFLKYLTDAVYHCQELMTLKIIFNGFDVNDDSLSRIYKAIRSILERRKLKTLWLQTTNLRKCREEDLIEMFSLIDKCGIEMHCEEINIQMADWQFDGGYLDYRKLVEIFRTFLQNIVDSLKYRKFRLQISSWYMRQKEAYKFLKDTLKYEVLRGYFQNSRNQNSTMNRGTISKLKEEEREEIVAALTYFLEHNDEKFLQPTYKYKRGDPNHSKQEQMAHKQMLLRVAQAEEIVSQKLVKYPNQYIAQLRVEDFHKNMTSFLGGLLIKLPFVQEYHIDLRNWHSMFGMSNLKKTLDTKVNSKQEFSLIRRSLGLASKSIGRSLSEGGQEQTTGLKTIYTM